MPKPSHDIIITELDHVRLSNLLERLELDDHPLHDVLIDAIQVSSREVDPTLVTMLSQVEVEFLKTGDKQSLFLNYPEDADITKGHVSILSPLGTAIIGRHKGDTSVLQSPTGETQTLRILNVAFQPEANGEYTV